MPEPASRWDSSAPIRYPDSDVLVLDPRFQKIAIGNTGIRRIATGFDFTEGPVWFGDGRYLLFSDIPNDKILRWDETTGGISVFRDPSRYANGNTRDRQGRLITCEHDTQRVTRTEYDGTVVVLADQWEGKKLTGPNDVVVKSDGTIWFSDNGAGTRGNYLGHTAAQEHPFRVYRYDPETATMTIAVSDMARPNGLCFSPDEFEALCGGYAERSAEEHVGLRHRRPRDPSSGWSCVLRRPRMGGWNSVRYRRERVVRVLRRRR